jgi:CDP-glucose 4,6-dehydratase
VIKFTSEWYYDFYKSGKNMFDKTLEQISEYEDMANNRHLEWME